MEREDMKERERVEEREKIAKSDKRDIKIIEWKIKILYWYFFVDRKLYDGFVNN